MNSTLPTSCGQNYEILGSMLGIITVLATIAILILKFCRRMQMVTNEEVEELRMFTMNNRSMIN